MKGQVYQWDSAGLPVYRYLGRYPVQSLDKTGSDAALPPDPCFILGNHRLTAFAHISGQIEILSGERGWMRLNHEPVNGYSNRAVLTVHQGNHATSIMLAGEEPFEQAEESFGAGYAQYQKSACGVRVVRQISAAPSLSVKDGLPCLRFQIVVENTNKEPVRVTFSEEIPVLGCMLSFQGDQLGDHPLVRYENTMKSDGQLAQAQAQLRCRFLKTMKAAENEKARHPYDCFPPLVFLQALQNAQAHAEWDVLSASAELALNPGEKREIVFLTGLSYDGEKGIAAYVSGMKAFENISDAWKRVLPDFSQEQNETLRWEMSWNAYVLECMATYHRYFDETFIPQGSVYAYRLGQNASQRDHIQHLLPEIRLNPALAKSCLRFVMKHMGEDGRIIRQDVGYGYEDQDVYWESDPQLYLFMAMGEYLHGTGDLDFLKEEIAFYPVENGRTHTVADALLRAFVYLRDVVRCGRHGLVMMRNSDWSDSFFHPYSPNVYAQVAESHMNTAMALAVLPRFIDEMEKAKNPDWTDWILEMRAWREKLYQAFMKDLGARDYAPRCYIGFDDDPALRFGEDRLCIEAQIWMLLMPDFPLERKKKLLLLLWNKLIMPEKLGARTRERPLWSENGGRGEDGGMWFAHQGVLLLALSHFDRDAGRKLLDRLTFQHFAECYPDYWVGQWTAPDSLESTLSDREGLYAAWVDHPFVPFCAHPHAWKLLGYLVLCDEKRRS